MRIVSLLCSLLVAVSLFAQKPEVSRIDPPNWWRGMTYNTLELLVSGTDIGTTTASVNGVGIRLVGQRAAENPNYLYLEVEIEPNAQPAKAQFSFTYKRKSISHAWDIKPRDPHPGRGIDASDFIYLIFPDRFANGNTANDRIEGMTDQSLNRDSMFHRHGGDIAGITQHLDYVQRLGATAIWINPLLENDQPLESYHGYAITDHYKVDPRFGTMQEYRNLVNKAHGKGLKIIGDVVFNHVGDHHWLVQDLPADNWLNQHKEFTRTSYRATTLLDPYASAHDKNKMTDGWFVEHMPDLNQRNPHVAAYLIQHSIWLTETVGLDGYRIDTYAYSDRQFMSDWAKAVKQAHPNVGMFGETWVHGTPVQAFFVGDNALDGAFESHLPGVTDFQMYYAINDALTQPFGWTEGVSRLYYTLAKDYIYANPYQNVVFLDNHDLSRFYSMVGEDLDKFKMGVGYLLTTRGIPSMYYGTEILMKNFADPDGKVREDFPGGWPGDASNKFSSSNLTAPETEAFEYIRTLANWRKRTPVLHDGKLMQFVPEKGVFVFFRYSENSCVMVVVNQNEEAKPLDMPRYAERTKGYNMATDVATGEQLRDLTQLQVPAKTTWILELGRLLETE